MTAILDYLIGPDDSGALDAAVAAAARGGAARRLHAALANTLTCAAVRPRLPELTQAQEFGLPLSADLRAVADHLTTCQDCTAVWAELATMASLAESGPLSPRTVPAPDLSFLPAAPPSLWRQIDAARHQFTISLQVAIGRAGARFRSLPDLLPAPQLVPASALREPGAAATAQRLTLPPAPGELAVELTVGATPGGDQLGVRLLQSDSQQPLPRVAVTLLNADHQPLRRVDTDAGGRATFADLLPDQYYLRVHTADGQWEIALVFVAADA